MERLAETNALAQLENYLVAQADVPDRAGDSDMDDGPEAEVLKAFPQLVTALDWLAANVTPLWRTADGEALRSQGRHRQLARVAIFSGTFAIVASVIQLALRLTLEPYSDMAGYFEIAIVVITGLAVLLGVIAKFDRHWLIQRNLAERLRMLKFQALAQFSCRERADWEAWVNRRLKSIAGMNDFASLTTWSREGEVEPEIPKPTGCERATAQALAIYYREKRIRFQARYFQLRRNQYEQKASRRRHVTVIFFLVSVFLALLHFVADTVSHALQARAHYTTSDILAFLAIWCAALAAIVPVVGFGIRAWFSAFQLPLSASVYEAKNRALLHALDHLDQHADDFEATLYHIAHVEQFLRDEHREWLRLLLQTEWFV